MDVYNSEVLQHLKELVENSKTLTEKGELEFEILELRSELSRIRETLLEQDISNLMDSRGEVLTLRQNPQKLKRKLQERRQRPVKSLTVSKNEDQDRFLLTPIPPFKKIKLKREKKLTDEEYKKEIEDLKKKNSNLETSLKLCEQMRKEKFKESENEETGTKLSKRYSANEKFLEKISKFTQFIDKFKEETEEENCLVQEKASSSAKPTNPLILDNPDIKLREELTTCEKEKCELLESREKNLLKITSQEAKIKSYEAQIERLEKDRKDKEDHQRKEYEREDKRLNEVKEKMTSLNYEKFTLERKLKNEISDWEKKYQEERSRVHRLLAENVESKRRIDELSAEVERLKGSEDCNTKVKKEKETQTATEVSESVKKLNETQKEDSSFKEKEIEHCKRELVTLQGRLREKESKISDLTDRCLQTEQEKKALRKNLDENLSEIGKLQDSLKEKQGKFKSSTSRVEFQTEKEALIEEPKKVKEQMNSKKTEAEEIEDSLRTTIITLQAKLKQVENNNKSLNLQVTKSDNKLKNLCKKYLKLQKEKDVLEKDEKYNADSIQISAKIIENLENELEKCQKKTEL